MPTGNEQCKTCTQIAEDHLSEVRNYVHAGHGRQIKLIEAMKNMTSSRISRQAVSRWLHQDPTKRQEPKLGAYLVMVKALQEIQRQE